MRRRPEVVDTSVDIRAHLLAGLKRSNDHWGLRANEEYPVELSEAQKDARRPTSIWGHQIAQLEAGEPVDIFGFALPTPPQPISPNGRYRVEADGTVTPIRRHR
jgi:hypothetical protein